MNYVNRRDCLIGLIASSAAMMLPYAAYSIAPVGSAIPSSLAVDPRRPQYHLLPAANWMNDPNGPIYWRGKYHLFYQYNPDGAYWSNMHWGHAISADMVHWKHLPVALAPTPGGPDADGCYTGSAVVENGRVVMLYTGVRSVPETQATIKDNGNILRETQCLAIASDAELRNWTKWPVPVLGASPEGMEVAGFRDPSPWRQGDWWYMVIGSGIVNRGGMVLLYRSKDLRSWQFLHVMASRENSPVVSHQPTNLREVWECPEIFRLGGKHLFIYSADGKAQWQSGVLDDKTMIFHPEKAGTLDYGCYYASKSQRASDGRRILWGWIPETRKEKECRAAGWAGMMSLPRVLSLDDDGQLRIDVAVEVERLCEKQQTLRFVGNEERDRSLIESVRITGCRGEVRCALCGSGESFELVLSDAAGGVEPWLSLKVDPLYPGQIFLDDKPLPLLLSPGEDLDVVLYVDGSVIEVFVNRQVAYTKRFYYLKNNQRTLGLQWKGKTSALRKLYYRQMSHVFANWLTL
jgi:beta-fructofuranosidase